MSVFFRSIIVIFHRTLNTNITKTKSTLPISTIRLYSFSKTLIGTIGWGAICPTLHYIIEWKYFEIKEKLNNFRVKLSTPARRAISGINFLVSSCSWPSVCNKYPNSHTVVIKKLHHFYDNICSRDILVLFCNFVKIFMFRVSEKGKNGNFRSFADGGSFSDVFLTYRIIKLLFFVYNVVMSQNTRRGCFFPLRKSYLHRARV